MWTWMLLHWRCEAQLACSWLAASGGGAVFSAASRVLPWLCSCSSIDSFRSLLLLLTRCNRTAPCGSQSSQALDCALIFFARGGSGTL